MASPARKQKLLQDRLPDVLRRIANELRELEQLTSRIEATLLGVLTSHVEQVEGDLSDVQHLDRQAQSLIDIAGFLERLGDALPPDQMVDLTNALSQMSLSDVAAALEQGKNSLQSANGGGDVELF